MLSKSNKYSFQAIAQVLFNLLKLGFGPESVEQGRFYFKNQTTVCFDQALVIIWLKVHKLLSS